MSEDLTSASLRISSNQASLIRHYSGMTRLISGLIFAICMSILFFAVTIVPQSRGFGTHTQLGLPECGFLSRTGHPCITCGMTTSFALMARGSILQAFATQPAGAIMALACLGACLITGYILIAGKRNRFIDNILDFILYRYITTGVITLIILLAGWLWTWLRISNHTNN